MYFERLVFGVSKFGVYKLMNKSNLPEKAYRNLDFLTSQDARIIRILSEFFEPQARFKKYNIVDTIVFFWFCSFKIQKRGL